MKTHPKLLKHCCQSASLSRTVTSALLIQIPYLAACSTSQNQATAPINPSGSQKCPPLCCDFLELFARIAQWAGQLASFADAQNGVHRMRHWLETIAVMHLPQQLMMQRVFENRIVICSADTLHWAPR